LNKSITEIPPCFNICLTAEYKGIFYYKSKTLTNPITT
jgi:hypothetical protein